MYASVSTTLTGVFISLIIRLDNSEYMRYVFSSAVTTHHLTNSNGDFLPTRFGAQAQAVSTVFSAKTDSNPESAVGLMTMAGKSYVLTLPACRRTS